MAEATEMLIYEPAECDAAHCHEPDCPYAHRDTWRIEPHGKPYATEAEAFAALRARGNGDV